MGPNKAKVVLMALLWLAILGSLSMGYKWLYRPLKAKREKIAQEEARYVKEDERIRVIRETSSPRIYRSKVRLSLDSFSGYAVFRSPGFRNHLASRGIKLEVGDDGADYPGRLRALKEGTVDCATFTVDALVKTSAEMGDLPATLVLLVDETRGADALLSYASRYPDIDSLNQPATRILLVKDSPSEMLVRLMRTSFELDKLGPDCMVYLKDGAEVFARFLAARATDDQVYVTWEPYVRKMSDRENVRPLVDSSNFRGYIVDGLVFNRAFLKQNHDVARDVVECYLRAAYESRDQMAKLIIDDARDTPLSDKQARALVAGIWWKNVQENYGHMNLERGTGLLNMEDMIANVTDVLVRSRAIASDPTGGSPNLLYYDRILRELRDRQFHPGESAASAGTVRAELTLRALTDEEWEQLRPVGTLQVEEITFRRGTSDLRDAGTAVLDRLVQSLNTWTSYYVSVRGDASTNGDQESNRELARRRADVVSDYLAKKGVDPNRVRAVSGKPAGTSRVSFALGQVPY